MKAYTCACRSTTGQVGLPFPCKGDSERRPATGCACAPHRARGGLEGPIAALWILGQAL